MNYYKRVLFNPDGTDYDENDHHSKRFKYIRYVEKVEEILPAVVVKPIEETLSAEILQR
jgi:hypothetical protein